MDESKVAVISEEDFDQAVSAAMISSLADPDFHGHFQTAMAFSMGGAIFARKVKELLFSKKEEDHE